MKAKKENELRTPVLLSTHNAMLGMISPNIRAISIDWGAEHYAIKAYFDRIITDDDFDILKSITTQVAADFPFMSDIKEFAEYSLDPIQTLKPLKEIVFLRYGELEF